MHAPRAGRRARAAAARRSCSAAAAAALAQPVLCRRRHARRLGTARQPAQAVCCGVDRARVPHAGCGPRRLPPLAGTAVQSSDERPRPLRLTLHTDRPLPAAGTRLQRAYVRAAAPPRRRRHRRYFLLTDSRRRCVGLQAPPKAPHIHPLTLPSLALPSRRAASGDPCIMRLFANHRLRLAALVCAALAAVGAQVSACCKGACQGPGLHCVTGPPCSPLPPAAARRPVEPRPSHLPGCLLRRPSQPTTPSTSTAAAMS